MRTNFILIVFVFFTFSVHCQNFVGVTKSSDGQTINLANDEVLEIKLPCQPSTGYGWYPILNQKSKIKNQKFNDGVITQTGDWEFIPDKNNGMVGQPGTEVIRFIGVSQGTSELTLEYKRPWEKEKSSVDNFKLTLISYGKYTGIYTTKTQSVEVKKPLLTSSYFPSSFSWQAKCTPIKNQGQCGSCWAFASTGSFEAIINIIDTNIRSLSEQWLINCDSDANGCGGGGCPNYLWVSPGAVYESDLPYTASNGICGTYTYYEKADSSGYVNVNGSSVEAIKQAIYNYGPVWISVDGGTSTFEGYTGGLYTANDGTTLDHAVVLVGWKDSTVSSSISGYWILRNSWGSGWGEHGYMRIGYGVNGLGADANYIVYKGGVPCSVTPNPGNTVSSVNPGCSSVPFSLSLQNATQGGDVIYQWQSSPDNSTWTNINGASDATYIASQTDTVYYRCEVTCSGNTDTSNVLKETVNPSPVANAGSNHAICTGLSTTIGATAIEGDTYSWESTPIGFTSTSSNPNVTPTVTTTYTLTETITATGCYNTNSVIVTVISPTASIRPADSASFCPGDSVVLTANTGTGLSYQWQNGSGNIPNQTTSTYTATTADVYDVVVTSSCSSATATSSTTTVTVQPIVTASVSSSSICNGNSINLTSTGSSYTVILLYANFNGTANSFTTINNSTGIPAVAAWKLEPDGYTYRDPYVDQTFHSNDDTQFYMSNSESNTGRTATILESPLINTIDYNSLSLDFYQYFYRYSSATAEVDVSTNGTTWTPVATYTSTVGSSTAFAHTIIPLNPYTGDATFYFRFNYNSKYAWYWAIDNVTLSGTTTNYDYTWSSTPAGFISSVQNPTNVTPTVSTTYTVTGTIPGGCSNSGTVSVIVNAIPSTPIVTSPVTYCQNDSASALTATGDSLLWYASATGDTGSTNAPTPSTINADSTNYYVSQTVNTCESPRAMIAINVNAIPSTPTISQHGDSLISSSVNGNQWYDQNGIIPDSTSSVFITTQNGNYYVIVTKNGCESQPSDTIKYNGTGVNTIKDNASINLYPNPAKNELTIEISNSHINQNLEILNSIGKTVYKSNITDKKVINVSGFADGIYIVRLFSDQSSYNKMFVKQQ